MNEMLEGVERAALGIELVAVALIVLFILVATAIWLGSALKARRMESAAYESYRRRLGRALLLGLEILVAADIIRTVALEATLVNIAGLGLLVLIRTFLSWSIVLEIESRWPWEARRSEPATEDL